MGTVRADVLVHFDDDLLAGIVLDQRQAFPWIRGTIVDGPALARWRPFVERFHQVERALDFAPYLPGDGAYEESDTARYVAILAALAAARGAGLEPPAMTEEAWTSPWVSAPVEELSAYIAFLDWTRWRATAAGGQPVRGLALPVSLDLRSRRISYRE